MQNFGRDFLTGFIIRVRRLGKQYKCPALFILKISFLPISSEAQTYTGTPDYPINDVKVIYDGLGDVAPLPGGTSVLERVLYAIDQMDLSSAGNVDPASGVFVNIAESVQSRQWYSTNRTEVAYENYSETLTDVKVQSTLLSYSDLTGTTPILTFADPTGNTAAEYGLDDVVYATITIYSWSKGSNRPELASDFATSGTLSVSLDQLGSVFDMENSNLDNFFEIGADGDIDFTQSNNYLDVYEYSIFIEVGGQLYHYDTVNSAEDSGTLYDGSPGYTITTGPYAGTYKAEDDILGLNEFLSEPISFDISSMNVYWSEGRAKLATTDQFNTNLAGYLPVVFDQTIEETVTNSFTRQLDSFFEDWNQRDVATTIDGSVTNVISGVTEATAAAGTAGAILVQEVDVGNIATTVLGAVNTGDIAVGVNSSANEATSAASRALTASMSVVGGSADTGSMMLNISHNSSVINGSVSNMLVAVNGSVGNIATTTLGAVNTGTISSGVFSAVQGIVGISD